MIFLGAVSILRSRPYSLLDTWSGEAGEGGPVLCGTPRGLSATSPAPVRDLKKGKYDFTPLWRELCDLCQACCPGSVFLHFSIVMQI